MPGVGRSVHNGFEHDEKPWTAIRPTPDHLAIVKAVSSSIASAAARTKNTAGKANPVRDGDDVVHHVAHLGATNVPTRPSLGPNDVAVELSEADR